MFIVMPTRGSAKLREERPGHFSAIKADQSRPSEMPLLAELAEGIV